MATTQPEREILEHSTAGNHHSILLVDGPELDVMKVKSNLGLHSAIISSCVNHIAMDGRSESEAIAKYQKKRTILSSPPRNQLGYSLWPTFATKSTSHPYRER